MRHVVTLLLLALLAVAAPVPKVKPPFGEFGDPAGQKGVELEMGKGGELSIKVPKDAALKDCQKLRQLRPLIARRVEGDFQLTVRVRHTPSPSAKAPTGGGGTYTATGIALYAEKEPKHLLALRHDQDKINDRWATGRLRMYCQHSRGETFSGGDEVQLPGDTIYWRLTRRGGNFTFCFGSDGEKWTELTSLEAPDFDAVMVGPIVAHSTNEECQATFDEYELKPLAKDEKK